jgi:hypothetical protein
MIAGLPKVILLEIFVNPRFEGIEEDTVTVVETYFVLHGSLESGGCLRKHKDRYGKANNGLWRGI